MQAGACASSSSSSTGILAAVLILPRSQRNPILPPRDDARAVPLSAMIDSVVVFLRHNLRKRLDVETYACVHLFLPLFPP